MARIYVRGPVLERMMRRRIVVGEDPVLCCWRWNGAHSKKTRKGYRDSPSRPVVRLGPGLGIYPVARLMLSFHDGVPLDQRGDLESGHVKCANPWWSWYHRRRMLRAYLVACDVASGRSSERFVERVEAEDPGEACILGLINIGAQVGPDRAEKLKLVSIVREKPAKIDVSFMAKSARHPVASLSERANHATSTNHGSRRRADNQR